MSSNFKISAALKGHEDDVRALAFTSSTVISASRDATVRAWHPQSSASSTYDDSIVAHAQAFINSVACLPPSAEFSEPLVASGGKEAMIDVRPLGRTPDADPERLLLGHQGNVCALDVCPDSKSPYLVSGSWDASAMVWDVAKGEPVKTLEGHTSSVWDVLAYDSKTIITACADHNIRIFSTDGKLIHTVKGGGDIVRALCRMPANHPSGAHFASAGNDSVIRLWTLDGQEVGQLHGHENFIYSLALLPSGELVSSGEDRTVRIWRDGKCVQTITHPAISVWAVAVNPENGDIASGASDRIVRVFSRSPDRQGSEEIVKAFEESVQQSSIPKQALDEQVNKDTLPGPDFLQKKQGVKEGQVQMIKEPNGNISAHQWSHLAGQWVNVGTVVDSAGSSGRKNQFGGKEYDYVFDVDIEEGKPPLKLPFNLSQNPYEVAQKFIADNELPATYVEQVADFILKNTQGQTFSQTTQSSRPVPETRPKNLPQKDYLTITSANFAIISRKVQEFNSQLQSGGNDVALSSDEVKLLPQVVTNIESSLTKGVSEANLPLLNAGSELIVKIVVNWPVANKLPGLDLLRCLVAAHPGFAKQHSLGKVLTDGQVMEAGNPNLTMLAVRALANLFAFTNGKQYAASNLEAIRVLVAPHMQSTTSAANRNIGIAAATCYVNFAVMLSKGEQGSADASAFAQTLLKDLSALLSNSKVLDSETVFRSLVAVGTLVKVPGAKGGNSEEVDAAVKSALGRCKEPRIKNVVDEMTT